MLFSLKGQKLFIEETFKLKEDVEDYWYRFEYQVIHFVINYMQSIKCLFSFCYL